MTGNEKLTILSISDIHLGHKKVPTQHIVSNLNHYLPDNDSMYEVDIIFLGGDIFDDIVSLRDDSTGIIQRFIVRLLKLCKKYDIQLRVLEGTPSHDGKQSKQFILLNEFLKINTDICYFDQLCIEYNERFNIHVLYVPDKWRGSCEQTKEEVVLILKQHGLTKVDYSIIHGQFKHQLPFIDLPDDTHDHEFYLSITKKYIFVGHIHFMSQFDRILAQGSFDRLRHKEEQPKGFFKVVCYSNNEEDSIIFIENKLAAIFKEIYFTNETSDEIILKLNQILCSVEIDHRKTHKPYFFKLVFQEDNYHEDIFLAFKKSYPNIKWDIKKESSKNNTTHTVIKPQTYVAEPINTNSILSIIQKRLNPLLTKGQLTKALLICEGVKNQLG